MKVLIAYSSQQELDALFLEIGNVPFSEKFIYKHLELYFCETGQTSFETAHNMALALEKSTYHLVLFSGLANSLNETMKVGMVLNVINDLPFEIGLETIDSFKSAYELNWLNKNAAPHVRGGFINMTSSYFNVFLNYMKTASITCNKLGGNEEFLRKKTSNYPIHIESSNGLAFQYACLKKGIPFYQLRVIEKNLILKNEDKNVALKSLNKELKTILDLL